MMKSIMFNSGMVKSILDGQKGVTRRIFKGYVPQNPVFGFSCFTPKGHISCRGVFKSRESGEKFYKMPYQVGDILYVRETAKVQSMKMVGRKVKMLFKADNELVEFAVSDKEYERLLKYEHRKNSLSPYWQTKETARIFLEVTSVRVERLQNITKDGIEKEGIRVKFGDYRTNHFKEFSNLWNSTIKKFDLEEYGWDANPWVWVIEFRRCEKPESESE